MNSNAKKVKYATVKCDIWFDNFKMEDCIFRLGLHNGEYLRFLRFSGTHLCECNGMKEYVNLNKMCRLTMKENDYEEISRE